MYYAVIKHSSHLRTFEKCRKHSPAGRVFYISLLFSKDHRVLSQCNTRLRLLYLLNILYHCTFDHEMFSFNYSDDLRESDLDESGKDQLAIGLFRDFSITV